MTNSKSVNYKEYNVHINELCKKCHLAAIDAGFWEEEDVVEIGNEKVISLKKIIPRNVSELLMLIVTELGEACEALRKNNIQEPNEKWRKDTFSDELADVAIRLFDLCGAKNIDLEWQIKKKMEYNLTRPKKHGKAF